MSENFLMGGGEMGARLREMDWSNTPLGSPEHWQQSLKTAVRIMLTSRQAMFVWWGDELINLYNDAYKAILGGKHPEVFGKPASEVWHEIWNQVGPRAESAIRNNEGTYDEALLLIMERNGYPEETYYTFSYSPVPNDQGGTGGIICANSDDTQRIIGERQLALLRELAARTANARTFDEACTRSVECLQTNRYDLPFAMIYLVDSDRHQGYLTGTSGIEVHHAAVPEIIDLSADSVWSFAEVLKNQKAVLIPDLASIADLPCGAWDRPPRQAIAVPISPSGQTGKAGILVVGLSPFRLFDSQYQGFIDLVAAQIAASIANAQAYEDERTRAEALVELDRAKTTFFSNVSHEFRTPLTLMLGPLEETLATASTRLDQQEREQLLMVQRNGLRLQKLVNALLDFSRIEAGRVQAVYRPTDLAAFTAELASVFRSAIERAGMAIQVNCSALSEFVYVDRDMWEKIVLNLLSNAFKFTFAGTISVTLKEIDRHVVLSVQDTGTGIPADELPQLFKRFHRVAGAKGRSYEGSGIGLSLVQELVKLHGGTIDVSSVFNQGTCFTVQIPIGTDHLPKDRVQDHRDSTPTTVGATPYIEEALRWLPNTLQSAEPIDESVPVLDSSVSASADLETLTQPLAFPNSNGQGITQNAAVPCILLADDNADMRDYVKRLLSQHYHVETVEDGAAAMALILSRNQNLETKRPIDLILSDVMMPTLDGFGLLRQLRTTPLTREIPVILLSARAGEEARIEGLEAGADDYLIKPFSARELLARVEGTLKLAQIRQAANQREQTLRLEAEAARQQIIEILERMTDSFLALDCDWRVTYVNEGVLRLTQMSRAEAIGKPIWEVWSSAIGTSIEQEYRRAMLTQMPIDFEVFYEPLQVWLEIHAYPSLRGLGVYFRDVTERKLAEATLRQSEERYRYLAESIPQLIWTANAAGVLLDVNQRWTDYTGFSLEQAQTQGWEAIVHPDDLKIMHDRWAEAQQNGRHYQAEGRMRRIDGAYRWHLHQAVPMKTESNQVTIWFGTATDIEEQKQLEQQRDRILQREQAARAKAERANRVKDEFLAVLSHELRTPLNPILGWSKLLQSGRLNPAKTAEALATIERNAQIQTQLIEDLLDVSRILQGKLSLTVNPVDLKEIITAATETVRLAVEAKGIEMQVSLTPNIGTVLGDAARLQQVVWNLLSNAVKFTPAKGRIDVRLQQVNNQAQIQVTDTGKGISADFLPYVFDYFRQADSATTRKFGGLGLGLAIVRQIVELHGGTVQADSEGEGQGSTFTIRVPATSTNSKTTPNGEPADVSLDLSGVHILVVDDEPDSRDFVTYVLEEAGATVMSTGSALNALHILSEQLPDIVVSDIGMPDMDGYMLVQEINSRFLAKKIPAIALTAYAGESDQQQALSAGFAKHLPKPVESEQLIALIISLVKQQ